MENDLLETHHVLILGALKKCHITHYHPIFEDYLQTARLTLIETHRRFIKEDKEMCSFNNYVFQRIYWKITDELRKEQKRTDRQLYDPEEETFNELIDTTNYEEQIEINLILSDLQDVLSPQETIFIEEAYLNDLSMTEIAKKHHVSRKTIYQWRNKASLKVVSYFQQ